MDKCYLEFWRVLFDSLEEMDVDTANPGICVLC
jgi:hypothetical protein